jgi:transcriptional regulator with XRE-family HTH domain
MPKSAFTDAYGQVVEALIDARKAAGITQSELGERLGKPQPFVSKYERKVRRLDVAEFYAIARALRRDPVELFSEAIRRMPRKIEI